jgi:hypothetical protein
VFGDILDGLCLGSIAAAVDFGDGGSLEEQIMLPLQELRHPFLR